MLAPWKESYDTPRQCIKKQRHDFANKDLHSQSYGFSSSHVQRESWTIKNAECRRMDAFKLWCWRRLLSPLDCKDNEKLQELRKQRGLTQEELAEKLYVKFHIKS